MVRLIFYIVFGGAVISHGQGISLMALNFSVSDSNPTETCILTWQPL